MELGKNVKKATTVKHRIFALYSLENDIGYILGAGKLIAFKNCFNDGNFK